MANEIELSIKIQIDPDLSRLVKSTSRKHVDIVTGETIPAKSSCYTVGYRYDKRLMRGYVSKETYHELIGA